MAKNDYNPDIYISRPYHAIYLSDSEGEDDDICVWKDRPSLSDFDIEDESLVEQLRKMGAIKSEQNGGHVKRPKSAGGADPRTSSSARSSMVEKAKSAETIKSPRMASPTKLGKSEAAEEARRRDQEEKEKADRQREKEENEKREREIKEKKEREEKEEKERERKRKEKEEREREAKRKEKEKSERAKKEKEKDKVPKQVKFADSPPSNITPKMTKTPGGASVHAQEIDNALSMTRRNLVHASQFLLKLEARAGKATKEGIRQTLDATVGELYGDDNFHSAVGDGNATGSHHTTNTALDGDHKKQIDELQHLSAELYNRLYLVDRHWRRESRELMKREQESHTVNPSTSSAHKTTASSGPKLSILGEQDVREWIKVELRTNHLVGEETCYFTVADWVSGRSFRDWVVYLRSLCRFDDSPGDQAKLVGLAWRFLDREIRGPRPDPAVDTHPTVVENLINRLDARRRKMVAQTSTGTLRGEWVGLDRESKRQRDEDAEAWRAIGRYWSSRTAPA